MNQRINFFSPLKTGYLVNGKNHVKRGEVMGLHWCLFVQWEQKTTLLYENNSGPVHIINAK
jgi:hypothetical protein